MRVFRGNEIRLVIFKLVLIDITGNKYNHLTVTGRGPDLVKKDGRHATRWWCICDCGNPEQVLVLGYNLKNGNTTSCGCEHLRNAKIQGTKNGPIQGKKNKKYNTYDLSGEYGVGYTLKGEEFYFDLEDYDLIKDICWYIDNRGYVVNRSDNITILMHRLIMGLSSDDKIEVYHIFHNTTDNRKENLRLVNSSQNGMNRSLQSNNTSGVTGVWYNNRTEKWAAEIGYYHNKIRLGEYISKDDAVKIRQLYEDILFDEYKYREEVIPHDNKS